MPVVKSMNVYFTENFSFISVLTVNLYNVDMLMKNLLTIFIIQR